MEVGGAQQEIDQVYMDDRDSRPMVRLSPTRIPNPHIADFLQQRLHVDTKSPRVWCRIDNASKIRDMLVIEAQENIKNRP
jgi:hypothetical protein